MVSCVKIGLKVITQGARSREIWMDFHLVTRLINYSLMYGSRLTITYFSKWSSLIEYESFSFEANCGAVVVRKWNKRFVSNKLIAVKFPPWGDEEAFVSSVSPWPEQMRCNLERNNSWTPVSLYFLRWKYDIYQLVWSWNLVFFKVLWWYFILGKSWTAPVSVV